MLTFLACQFGQVQLRMFVTLVFAVLSLFAVVLVFTFLGVLFVRLRVLGLLSSGRALHTAPSNVQR